ncbi:hypothetical protein PTKIN_Ptkin01aG0344600 [Pterospermum kingtungense]
MASGYEYFSRAGPSHLISVDWNNAHHRRSVAASLVMGAYMIEDDRLKRRQGSQSLAPPWWEFFPFKSIYQLTNDDNSILGAIFEYKTPAYTNHRAIDQSPLCVVKNNLHQSPGVEIAMSVVQDVVAAVGDSKVWSAGTLIKAGLALAARDSNNHEDPFAAMSGWIPCLFVNQVDIVCSECIGYFRHRKKLEAMGARALARISSHRSLGNTITSAVGIRGVETSEPLRLIPSAKLTENLCAPQYITEAHGLSQWWRPNMNLKCTVYNYT